MKLASQWWWTNNLENLSGLGNVTFGLKYKVYRNKWNKHWISISIKYLKKMSIPVWVLILTILSFLI
jgi:hypothetical protein